MEKHRLAGFADAFFAVIITVMVVELKPPHEASLAALAPLTPVLLSYVLSFIYIGIYWNNHHHLMSLVRHVHGGILWANMFLLFWLSLVPFATEWAGETRFQSMPTAVYGGVLLLAALGWLLLQHLFIRAHGEDRSALAQAIGPDYRGKVTPFLYLVGIGCAFWLPWLGEVFYILAALIWLIPDPRIERRHR